MNTEGKLYDMRVNRILFRA